MSIKAIQAVWDHSTSTGNDRLILLAIADACDHDGRGCWKGKETLAAMARCSRSTATECIRRLTESGELHVEKRSGYTNVYAVILPGLAGVPAPADGDPAWSDPRRGQGPNPAEIRPTDPAGIRPTSADGVAGVGRTGGRDPSLPVKEPSKRARNPIFDGLAAVYPHATGSESTLIGSVAAELAKLDPVPTGEEVFRRARWARREWPTSTARAVAKHWTMIGERLGQPRLGEDDDGDRAWRNEPPEGGRKW